MQKQLTASVPWQWRECILSPHHVARHMGVANWCIFSCAAINGHFDTKTKACQAAGRMGRDTQADL